MKTNADTGNSPWKVALSGSFRRQIIVTFAVGFLVLVSAFATYMVKKESAYRYHQSNDSTFGLAQSLAVSSRSWVMANDVVGLQEVMHSFQDYPELRYVMVVSPAGRVLAHSDAAKVGQFLSDHSSMALIGAQPVNRVVRDDEFIIDVAVPIEIEKRHIGWARIALGRAGIARDLREVVLSNAIFVLAAFVLSLFAAFLIAKRLGLRIRSLVRVAEEVQGGNFATRAVITGRKDEIAKLADSMNQMLDVLARNENELHTASRYTRSLFEASVDPLVTISAEGKITDVNGATEKVTGRSREELVGTDFSDYFTEPDKARAGYRQVFTLGAVTDYPLAIRHRNGHLTNVLYNASIYKNEAGEVQGVFAAARDVSEQQRAIQLRAQLAAIVESSSDGIIGKSLDGIILSWNRGAERIYGYVAEDVIGKHITVLAPTVLHPEVNNLMEAVLKGGTISNYETQRLRKDGTLIEVDVTLSPIRDAEGRISGVSTIVRDISERKHADQERVANLHYFESMDKVNRAMQGAKNLEGMMVGVLDVVLEIFDCVRVGLAYPCDPHSPTWQIMMERAKPGYGTAARHGPLPMNEVRADSMRCLLESSGPVQFSPDGDPPLSPQTDFGIRSFMSIAVYPRIGDAWEFGIHQCAHVRLWNGQEMRLFEEIGRRLADGLNAMLAYRDLEQSEQRFRMVFENSPVSIWEEDFSEVKGLLDGLRQQGVSDLGAYLGEHPQFLQLCAEQAKIMEVNTAAQVLHGAASKQELLDGLVRTFTPASFETFREELVCLWAGGMHLVRDAEVRTLAGELRHVTVYFAVSPGHEAKLDKVLVSLADITERKRAEEDLKRMNERFNLASRAAHLGVWDWNLQDNKLAWDDRMYELYGVRREDFAGAYEAWLSGLHPDDRAHSDEVSRQAQQGEREYDTEFRVIWPDGSIHHLKAYGQFVRDAQDRPLRMIGINFDITELKHTEEVLRLSEEALRVAQRIAHLGSWYMDLVTHEVFWSEELYRMYGFDPAFPPPLYTESMKLFTQESWERLSSSVARAVEAGIPYELELEMVPKAGSTRWMMARGELVRDEHGKAVRVQGVVMDITERKLAEVRLATSESRLRTVVETEPECIKVVDAGGRLRQMNPAGLAMIEADSLDQVAGRSVFGLIAPEYREAFVQMHARVLAGEPQKLEFVMIGLKGKPLWLETHAVPMFDGNEIVHLAVTRDVTERKRAEERLRHSEHGLSEAQRIAHLGNWELDLEKNVLTWSDEIFRIFEIDPEHFGASYEAFLNAIHPEDREMVNQAYTDSVRNRARYDIVHRLLMPDGRIKHVNERCETYYGADGKPLRSVGTVHDITERKLDELALLQQQSHSNSLLHLSRRLERAQSYADILAAAGDEVRELIGYRNLWVYLLSDDRQYFTALIGTGAEADLSVSEGGTPRLTIAGDRMLEQIAEAKEIVLIEDAQTSDIVNKEIVRKLGNRTIVNIPIILFDRHLGSVGVGTFGDEGVKVPTASEQKYLNAMASHMAAALDRIYLLDHRRKAEREVQELNRDLEQRVEERTEQLEAANKELESFSYSVSHDLRSPLRAIDGFSHILLEDYAAKLDEEGKRMLNVVRDNTVRMGQLIDDILQFSRTGRLELASFEVDMESLAHDVTDSLYSVAGDAHKPQMEIGHLPPTLGDRAMLRQVFVNLLSNAIKFSRSVDTPRIQVGAEVQGSETIYFVKDNGVGFNMEYVGKLFGVFQRLHSMEEFEGTGIGLAIVKRIVTRHGGRVWAEGKVNEGATIYFALPGYQAR